MTDTSGADAGAASGTRGVGTRRGEYELVHALSETGSGGVYLARAKGPTGPVRIVMLESVAPDTCDRGGGVENVIAQGQRATKVKSFNVASPIDARDENGVIVVSDPIDGATLVELMDAAAAAGEKIPIEVVLRIIVDALAGLHAAHQTKPDAVMHGGLRPSTWITAAEGTTKVTDFALARFRDPALRAPYAADVDASGEPTVAGDVFSAGVIAWELLTGKRLFGGDSPVVTDRSAEIPAPSTLAESIPAKLDAAITKALARDATARFATAAEFARAIETSGSRVALRSAVGGLVTRLLKEPLAQRRELVRKLRTSGGVATASSTTAPKETTGAIRAPAPGLSMPKAPEIETTTKPAVSPAVQKPGASMRLPTPTGTKIQAPAAVASTTPAKGTVLPKTETPASQFGAPAVAPSGVAAPRTLGTAPIVVDGGAPRESTMPLDAVDVESVSVNPPPPPPPKRSPDTTMPIEAADVTDVPVSAPPPAPISGTPAKESAPATTPAHPPSPSESTHAAITPATASAAEASAEPSDDFDIPIESSSEVPSPPTAATAAPSEPATPASETKSEPTETATEAKAEVPVVKPAGVPPVTASAAATPAIAAAATGTAGASAGASPTSTEPVAEKASATSKVTESAKPTGAGFDDEPVLRKGPIAPVADDEFENPPAKSRTMLYGGIAVLAVVIIGGAALMMRGGNSNTALHPAGPSTSEPTATSDAGATTTPSMNTAATHPTVPTTNPANGADVGAQTNAAAAADAGTAPSTAQTRPTEPPPTHVEEPPPAANTHASRAHETPAAPHVATPPASAHVATHPTQPSHPTTPAVQPTRPVQTTATRATPPARTPSTRTTPPRRREFRPGGL